MFTKGKKGFYIHPRQGSHFSGLTKFHDFSRFFGKFPGIFSLFLKCNFQAVLNINVQPHGVSFEQKLKPIQLHSKLVNLPFYFSILVSFTASRSRNLFFNNLKLYTGLSKSELGVNFW